jgi:pRiA4b ORF-3-like protein
MSGSRPSGPFVRQLRVVLRGGQPPDLAAHPRPQGQHDRDLHATLQLTLGWGDDHLHRFLVHGREYGISYASGITVLDDSHDVRVADLGLRAGERFLYAYDFIDGWGHDVRVEPCPWSPQGTTRSAQAAGEPSLRRTAEVRGRSWSFGSTTHPSPSSSGWSRSSKRWATVPTTSTPSARSSRSSGPGSRSIASTGGSTALPVLAASPSGTTGGGDPASRAGAALPGLHRRPPLRPAGGMQWAVGLHGAAPTLLAAPALRAAG